MEDSKQNGVCPFYKGGGQNTICCETGISYIKARINFREEAQKKDHIERFCEGAYNECMLAQDIDSLKEVEARDVEPECGDA